MCSSRDFVVFSHMELADFKEETWLFGNYGLSFAADLSSRSLAVEYCVLGQGITMMVTVYWI
jgi:hypothetical protein